MKYKFSNRSQKRLSTCHPDLILVMNVALSRCDIDFGIAEGHRPINRQQELFKKGLSKLDGINRLGKHNYNPSKAVDVFGWVAGKVSYNFNTLCYIAGVVQATAKELLEQEKISHKIRWGGNWDRDGEIITDQTFQDLVHFEIE